MTSHCLLSLQPVISWTLYFLTTTYEVEKPLKVGFKHYSVRQSSTISPILSEFGLIWDCSRSGMSEMQLLAFCLRDAQCLRTLSLSILIRVLIHTVNSCRKPETCLRGAKMSCLMINDVNVVFRFDVRLVLIDPVDGFTCQRITCQRITWLVCQFHWELHNVWWGAYGSQKSIGPPKLFAKLLFLACFRRWPFGPDLLSMGLWIEKNFCADYQNLPRIQRQCLLKK